MCGFGWRQHSMNSPKRSDRTPTVKRVEPRPPSIDQRNSAFEMMLAGRERPTDVTTDLAPPLLRVVDELLPEVLHDTTQYANNQVECDHGRLKARLRPMRSLRTDRTASPVIRGHAFVQNLRRGHYELGVDARQDRRRLVDTAQHCDTLNSGWSARSARHGCSTPNYP
jgi:hypothetical protein